MEDIVRLAAYYREQAEAFVEHIPEKMRPALSLAPYFENDGFLVSTEIMRAFFGDEAAMQYVDELRSPFFSDDEIISCSINSGYLNPSQLRAVKCALSNYITLIQGPPGTGKTEVILNILSCVRQLCPAGTSAAVLSTNNEALQNIHEKIREDMDSNPQLNALYGSIIQLGSLATRAGTYESRPDLHEIFETVTRGRYTSYYMKEDFTDSVPFFTSTIHSVRKLYQDAAVGAEKKYDYVIVDECSQAGVMLGLIAMSCGKRVVLIGDVEQLAPVFNDNRADELRRNFSDINPLYMEESEKSFLEVCRTVFGQLEDTSVMLTGHYRCHPSIIGFNNKYVYNGMLEPLARTGTARMLPADKLAIRVVWYEGDYFEIHKKPDGKRPEHTNFRQQRILFEEEMPRIIEKLRRDPDYSVGIIAPYRSILEYVREELDRQTYRADLGEVTLEDDQAGDSAEDTAPHFAVLTIHRSQGKGCNCIIYLSSEDSSYETRWPWSQQKRMMNVAVSRAKNELCVITSSLWLPVEFQDAHAAHTIAVKKKNAPEEERDNLFLYKLLDYVYRDCAELDCGEEYGFHKSAITSIFDEVPYYREKYNTARNTDGFLSAPALCMKKALEKRYPQYSVFTEVPLTFIAPESAPNEQRLDFVVCSGSRVLAAIEVDGAYHREDETQLSFDEKKDEIMSHHPGTGYLRVATDGSETGELMKKLDKIIRKMLLNKKNVERLLDTDMSSLCKWELSRELSCKLNRCCAAFDREYRKAHAEHRDISVIFPDYQSPDAIRNIRYDNELTDMYYLCHFGAAYAFEYALMYEIVLRDKAKCFNELSLSVEPLSVLSLGCGSMIDLWSMKYVIAKLADRNIYDFKLEGYRGVDLVNWPVKMADLDANIGDIGACFGNGIVIWNNVIVFPKVLNELSGEDIDELVEGILQTKFPAREYYICFSHNRSNVADYYYKNEDHGLRISGRIVEAIREAVENTGCFDGSCRKLYCNSDIIGRGRKEYYLRDLFGEHITDELCNEFVRMDSGFYSVGYSFTHADGVQANRFSDYDDTFCIRISPNKTMAQYFNQLDDIADVMNRTSNLVFQIVKIRR